MSYALRTLACVYAIFAFSAAHAQENPDFIITAATVTHNKKWGQLEFEIIVKGNAGKTVPNPPAS